MSRRTALLLCFLLTAVTAATAKEQTWLQISTSHFVVVSNAGEKPARHVADQLERMRSVFHSTFPKLEVDPGAPIVVLAVRDQKDFRTLEPQAYLTKGSLDLAGIFMRVPDKNYILLRLDVGGEHPYETIYHEYTHLIYSKSEEWMPLWLTEGLAEFFQTADIDDKEVRLGEPSVENIYLLRQSTLLPIATLFTVDRTSPYYHEQNKGSIFYAEAWALTHYLWMRDHHDRTQHLSTYADMLSQKVDPVTAATQAFGDLRQLQVELQRYVGQGSFTYIKRPNDNDLDSAAFKVEPLKPTQADAVRADFMAYNDRGDDARALDEQILKEDPNNTLAHETMGYLEFRQGHRDEALKWYEQAVKLDSQSYLAHYYYAAMSLNGAASDPARDDQVESSFRTCIKLNPAFAPAYDGLAVFFWTRHKNLDEAHMLALNAVTLEPANVAYRMNTANILMTAGRTKDAIAVMRKTIPIAKSSEEAARIQNQIDSAERFEASQEALAERNREDDSANGTKQATASANDERDRPTLTPRFEELHGPHKTAKGVIKGVKCSAPAVIELSLEAPGNTLALRAANYFKIKFSALNFAPTENLEPCTDLEGMQAQVEFIESPDKTTPGQIVAVGLSR